MYNQVFKEQMLLEWRWHGTAVGQQMYTQSRRCIPAPLQWAESHSSATNYNSALMHRLGCDSKDTGDSAAAVQEERMGAGLEKVHYKGLRKQRNLGKGIYICSYMPWRWPPFSIWKSQQCFHGLLENEFPLTACSALLLMERLSHTVLTCSESLCHEK